MHIKETQKKGQKVMRYILFGLLTTLVGFISYYILIKTILSSQSPLQLQVANVISWSCAVIFAYITNRIYVFKSQSKHYFKEFSAFTLSRLGTLLLEMLVMHILVFILSMNDVFSKVLAQAIVIISNYLLSNELIFKSKKS